MQDPTGFFYYRRYPLLTAKIPMLHWGQATMYHALSVLLGKSQEVKVGSPTALALPREHSSRTLRI